ncbi:MAG: type II toxin-antitoxin system RelE/ParE family toxin [Thermoanaerobaculales bacterium]
MIYSLQIKRSAAKALARISKNDRFRLIEAIDRLRAEPNAGGVLKGEFAGLRRLRVGSFRIIYEVIDDQLLVLVVRVAHRSHAYRSK